MPKSTMQVKAILQTSCYDMYYIIITGACAGKRKSKEDFLVLPNCLVMLYLLCLFVNVGQYFQNFVFYIVMKLIYAVLQFRFKCGRIFSLWHFKVI